MKFAECDSRRHQNAPPHHGADTGQPEFDLEDRVGVRREVLCRNEKLRPSFHPARLLPLIPAVAGHPRDPDALQQIETAHARNLAVQRSRMASMPEVGIFWLIANKLVANSIPWRQADVFGGFYSGKTDHAAFWTTLQRLLPQWNGKEYTDFSRARVLFDSMEEVFRVYSSQGIVNSPRVRKMIITDFKLPLTATKFEADYHYENEIPLMLDEVFDKSPRLKSM